MNRIHERTTRPSGSMQRKERADHMNLRSMSHRLEILKTHLVIAVRAALADQVFNLAKAAEGVAVWIKWLTVTNDAPEILKIILVEPHCPTILKNNGMKHDMPLIFQTKPTADMPYSVRRPRNRRGNT